MNANDKIKVHLFDTNKKEIKTRNFEKVFTVCEENGKLGIYWMEEFTPFDTFAQTVIFENVETNERYYFDNIKNNIVKLERDSIGILLNKINQLEKRVEELEKKTA